MRRKRLKPRRVTADITRGVLTFKGPSNEVKMLWLHLWSYRDRLDRVSGVSQAQLTELVGCSSERTLRDRLADAHRWHMLSIHAGVHGNESLYVLHHPDHWWAVRQADRHAFLPHKRSAAAAAAASDTDVVSGGVSGASGGASDGAADTEPDTVPAGVTRDLTI